MIEFYLTNTNREDTGSLPESCSIDMELGDPARNDFELTIPYSSYDKAMMMDGGYIYAHGTEYGGRLGDLGGNTRSEVVTFTGDAWRGLLDLRIVKPPKGEDYLTMSGDLSECVNQLIGARYGDLFRVSTIPTGVLINEYQVEGYVTILEALNKMLGAVGYRLDIKADGSGERLYVDIAAVPTVDYSEDEISQDSGMDFKLTDVTRLYNYMTCVGGGDEQERQVMYLHRKQDGTVEEVDAIPDGIDVREFYNDLGNAEDRGTMLEQGTEKFDEINKTEKQEVAAKTEKDVYEIGDIIGGRDYITGITTKTTITKKIIRYDGDELTIDYADGGSI